MWEPDRLNFEIMKELAGSPSRWAIRRPYTEIAKKLGVDEETVRNRLRQLKESGFLRGWRLMVNPGLIGREASALQWDLEDAEAKDRTISGLKLVEGVVLIHNFHGKSFWLMLFHEGEDGLERGINNIASSCGGKLFTHWKVRLPPCEHTPTVTDWQIIGLLLKNAEGKLSRVAHDLKISTRTAKRRVDKMMGSQALFYLPILDHTRARAVPCDFLIQFYQDKKRIVDDLIISKFDRVVFRLTDSSTHSMFTIPCANTAEAQEISVWIRKQEGVKSVTTNIREEQIHVQEWLEKEIQRRLSTQQNMRNPIAPIQQGESSRDKIRSPPPSITR